MIMALVFLLCVAILVQAPSVYLKVVGRFACTSGSPATLHSLKIAFGELDKIELRSIMALEYLLWWLSLWWRPQSTSGRSSSG